MLITAQIRPIKNELPCNASCPTEPKMGPTKQPAKKRMQLNMKPGSPATINSLVLMIASFDGLRCFPTFKRNLTEADDTSTVASLLCTLGERMTRDGSARSKQPAQFLELHRFGLLVVCRADQHALAIN